MKKLFGFTLSEILLSLAIIGIVAVLTLPMFIQNHQKQVYVTQLKETYSLLSQAFQKVLADKDAVSLAESGVFRDYGENFLTKYFKTVNICPYGDSSKCIDFSEYKRIDGSDTELTHMGSSSSLSCANLVNGSTVCIFLDPKFHHDEYGTRNSFNIIIIDVNGKKKPNVAGRDFYVALTSDLGQIVSEKYDGSHNGLITELNALQTIIDAGWKMEY